MKELGADLELVNWEKLKLNHNKYDIILPKDVISSIILNS